MTSTASSGRCSPSDGGPYAAYRIVGERRRRRAGSTRCCRSPADGGRPHGLSRSTVRGHRGRAVARRCILDAALEELSAGQAGRDRRLGARARAATCVAGRQAHTPVAGRSRPGRRCAPPSSSSRRAGADAVRRRRAADALRARPPRRRAPLRVPRAHRARRRSCGCTRARRASPAHVAVRRRWTAPRLGGPRVPRAAVQERPRPATPGGADRRPGRRPAGRRRSCRRRPARTCCGSATARPRAPCSAAATRRRGRPALRRPGRAGRLRRRRDRRPGPDARACAVDGVRWDEVPSLYGAGPARGLRRRSGARTAASTVEFGDGVAGRAACRPGAATSPPTYRVGGGTAGEVESGRDRQPARQRPRRQEGRAAPARPTAAPTRTTSAGCAALAPARARAFGRAVSREDLVDLALGYPGVTHAAAWHGAGPPGCACGARGPAPRLPARRHRGPAAAGREPRSPRWRASSTRDATPRCRSACAPASVTAPGCCGADARRRPAPRGRPTVVAAAAAALADPDGPLAPDERALGQPLDRSDVLRRPARRAGRRRRRRRLDVLDGAAGRPPGRSRRATSCSCSLPDADLASEVRGMSRPAVADWLPPALRDAPDDPAGSRACSTRCSRRSIASARCSRPTSTRSGTTSSSRAAPTGRSRTSARCSACRPTPGGRGGVRDRAAPAQGHAGGARGLRRGADRLDGARARGLAGHAVGAAARASAAAARRRRSTCATARASALGTPFERARRSVTPSRPVVARARPPRSCGRGRCGPSTASQARAVGRAAASRCTRSAPRRRSTSPGRAASRTRRRAGAAHRRRARRAGARRPTA